MLIGAYTYAIFMTPIANGVKDGVFYRYEAQGGSLVGFSFPELFNKLFGGGEDTATISLILGVIAVMLLAGLIAVLIAYLIGLPVLRLKSDYLAIATLGFAEILRAVFQWEDAWEGHEPFWARITNGANMIKAFPTFRDFNVKDASGKTVYYFATLFPFIVAAICIALILLLINSTYGRAFKAVRDDEIAAEAMGINLASTKRISFCISAFFAAVGGVLYAMFTTTVQAKPFTSALTYELLLIVVIGGIGSVSGSCVASFLYVACSEWWLRFLDRETTIGSFKVPLLGDGFRMVVFSVVIMIIVLFFQKGIFGDKEFTNVFKRKKKTLVGGEEKKA